MSGVRLAHHCITLPYLSQRRARWSFILVCSIWQAGQPPLRYFNLPTQPPAFHSSTPPLLHFQSTTTTPGSATHDPRRLCPDLLGQAQIAACSSPQAARSSGSGLMLLSLHFTHCIASCLRRAALATAAPYGLARLTTVFCAPEHELA